MALESSHLEEPCKLTLLYAVRNPRQGGDTEYCIALGHPVRSARALSQFSGKTRPRQLLSSKPVPSRIMSWVAKMVADLRRVLDVT